MQAGGNPASEVVQAADTDQPPVAKNDWEMEEWLYQQGKMAERLIALGVEKRTAENYDKESSVSVPSVNWKSLHTGELTRSAVLFISCDWTSSAHLYLMQDSGGIWHVADQIEADCHYDDSVAFELIGIRNPNRDEILLHHVCEGRGTGYLKQSFSVLLPIRGKLKEVLSTDEVLHSFQIEPVQHDLNQTSTFAVLPIAGRTDRAIEQTRSSVINGRLTVQRRIFRWNPIKGRYTASKLTTVEATAK